MIPASETIAIREELDTLKQKVAHLAIKYEDQYPDLLQDYTHTMLLYVLEYEDPCRSPLDHRVGLHTLYHLCDAAGEGLLVNFTSLHRAITEVKRDFQTPALRKDALKREAFWGEAMTWRD